MLVERPALVDLDGAAMTARLAGRDPATVVSRTAVPALDFGVIEVQVVGRLPRPWIGALSLGVGLEAPPDPPFRFQAISRSVDLDPGSDTVAVPLDVGGGTPVIVVTTHAVLEDQQGAHGVDGPPRQQQGTWIEVHGDDMPVGMTFLSATPSLLALGEVAIEVTRPPWNPLSTSLTPAQPSIAIVAPRNGDPAPSFDVRLRSADGSQVVEVASGLLQPRQFDASSVAGFGHHEVAVTAVFSDSSGVVAIDLTSEASLGDGTTIKTLELTASAPAGTWTYFAPSPFRAGYCWRLNDGSVPPAPWSPAQPATAPLIVNVPAAVSGGG
jgi:hypothetical protein